MRKLNSGALCGDAKSVGLMVVFREGLRWPMDPAESLLEVDMQFMRELGEERMRLFRSNCELLDIGEIEMGRFRPNLWLDAVRGLIMPEPSGDGYPSKPSRENVELGKLVSSCEMELGVPERLGKSGDTIPAYCISPGDGPTPLREREDVLPSADSCDLLSPFRRPAASGARESPFRRCPPPLSPLLDRSAALVEVPSYPSAPELAEAHCWAGSSVFAVTAAFSMGNEPANSHLRRQVSYPEFPYLPKRCVLKLDIRTL